MQPSGSQSPLPSSPLPPSPIQAWYESQIGAQVPGQAPAVAPPSPPPAKPVARKGPPPAAIAVFVIFIVVIVLVLSGALDFLINPSGSSNQPTVQVSNTSASHVCPLSSSPTETFLFTLTNTGSMDASVTIGFYLNDAQVKSGTYYAAIGSSTPYTETATLSSCPPSGSTYYLDLLSVTAA